MSAPRHVFVTYIRTTPAELWAALTRPEITRRFFHETRVDSEWKPGAPVYYRYADGSVAVDGEVLDVDEARVLSISWHVRYDEEQSRERPSRVTFEIESVGPDQCRLTLVHDDFDGETKTWRGVGQGWPWILDSLKTLLETGEPLPPPTEP